MILVYKQHKNPVEKVVVGRTWMNWSADTALRNYTPAYFKNDPLISCTHHEFSGCWLFEQPEARCLRNTWSFCLTSVEATALSSCFSFFLSASRCSRCLISCSCFCCSQKSFRCCRSCCSCCSARCCCCCWKCCTRIWCWSWCCFLSCRICCSKRRSGASRCSAILAEQHYALTHTNNTQSQRVKWQNCQN